MSAERTGITFVPRSTPNCLDLAVMYCGRRLWLLLMLWLCVAGPACALVYALSYYYQGDLRMMLAVVYWATAVFGAWLVACVAPATVADMLAPSERPAQREPKRVVPPELLDVAAVALGVVPLLLLVVPGQAAKYLTPEIALAAIVLLAGVLLLRGELLLRAQTTEASGGWEVAGRVLGMRTVVFIGPFFWLFFTNGWLIFLGIVLTLVPGLWVAVRYGFVAERAALRRLSRRLHHRKTEELIAGQAVDLFVRGCGIAAFFATVWIVLFLTADTVAFLLFRIPVFLGQMDEFTAEELWHLLVADPRVLTLLAATGLLTYPMARLAWFLCYIDVRIRRDCWDMELSLAQESERLETSPP